MGCASSSDRNSASFAIERAIDDGDLEKLKKLLRDGASPEGNHDNGGSALHRCVHTKQVAMTRHLIEAGADVNFQDSYGRKPLDVAYVRNQYQPSEARRRIIGYLEAATKKLYWDQMQQELQEGKQGTMISLVAPKGTHEASMEDGAQEGAPGEEGDTVHEHQMKRFEEISSSSITVGDMCVVCQDTGLQVAVLPCRHEYMCVGCAVRMIPMFLKGVECLQACAICREPLEALLVTRDAPASEDACNDSARTVLPRSSVSSNSQPPAADKTLLELQDPDLDTPCKPGSEDVSKRGIRKSLRESEVELQPTP